MANLINRRSFVSHTAASAAGIILGPSLMGFTRKEKEAYEEAFSKKETLMQEVMKYRKIDAHAHVDFTSNSPATELGFADRLGIERLMISRPMRPHSPGIPEEFIASNNLVLKNAKAHPDRFTAVMTLNPAYKKQALEEINRCIGEGAVGMKLYNHVKISDPLFYPIIEKFIPLKMPILMHTPIGTARVVFNAGEPKNSSLPEDFVEIATRYPEQTFIHAHSGGGHDWENSAKIIADTPNIYADMSGSNNESNMVDFVVKHVGEDRVVFGCDGSFYQAVGHILDASVSESQKKKIFFENYNNLLRKAGKHVS